MPRRTGEIYGEPDDRGLYEKPRYDPDEVGNLEKFRRSLYGESQFRATGPKGENYGYGLGRPDMGSVRLGERADIAEARRMQLGGLDPIRQRALGIGGPSVAEQQLGRGLGQVQAAIAQRAAGARGQSRAAAQTAAASAQGGAGARAASDAALLRAQERIAAQQLYQQGLGQMRGQDIQTRGYGLEETKALEDQKLRAQEINERITSGNAQRGQSGALFGLGAAAGLLGLGSDISQKDVYSRGMPSDYSLKEQPTSMVGAPTQNATPVTDVGGTPLPLYLNVPTAPTPTEGDAAQRQLEKMQEASSQPYQAGGDPAMAQPFNTGSSLGGGLSSLVGGLFSDYSMKEISRRDLDPIIPTGYQYKPEASERMANQAADQAVAQGASPGAVSNVYNLTYADKRSPRDGIVAQDLQRSPAFRDSVIEEDGRLAIERDRALSTALNELGGLNQRLAEVEARTEVSNPNESAEVKRDFAELEAMMKKEKSSPRPKSSYSAPSAAESYVKNRMRGGGEGYSLGDTSPKLDFKREGSDRVIVIDDNMRSDFNDKEVSTLQKRNPRMRRFMLKAAIDEMKTAQSAPYVDTGPPIPTVWQQEVYKLNPERVPGIAPPPTFKSKKEENRYYESLARELKKSPTATVSM